MKSNYQRTADWLKSCGKEPSPENLSLQIACHLEEMAEFLYCLTVDYSIDRDELLIRQLKTVSTMLSNISTQVKSGDKSIRVNNLLAADMLDALCDMEVTGNGVAYLAGWDKEAADQAVLASNEAKLVDGKPVILPSGKIGKPEGWQAPDLSKFV